MLQTRILGIKSQKFQKTEIPRFLGHLERYLLGSAGGGGAGAEFEELCEGRLPLKQ